MSRQLTCVFLLSTMLIAAPSAHAHSIIGQLAALLTEQRATGG